MALKLGSFIPVVHAATKDRPDEIDTLLSAEAVAVALAELGFVTEGKREEESYKRRRQVRAAPVPPPDPNSPFSVLARLRETWR